MDEDWAAFRQGAGKRPGGWFWGGPDTGNARATGNIRGSARGTATAAGLKTPRPAARDLGKKHGLIYFTTDFERVKGSHRLLPGAPNSAGGQFTSAQADQARLLALRLADAMAEQLRGGLRRPSVATGRLAAALRDERNIYADSNGFGVGNPKWLNASPAPYWRAIEQGTSYFVGRHLPWGIWGSSIESIDGGGPGRYGAYPLAGPGFSLTGQGGGGRLRPLTNPGTRAEYNALRRELRSKNAAARSAGRSTGTTGRGTIKVPITAHHYMKNAWDNFDARKAGREIAQTVLRAYLEGPEGRMRYAP